MRVGHGGLDALPIDRIVGSDPRLACGLDVDVWFEFVYSETNNR